MDVQIKKGLLDVCVLSVISRSDSYGYQIIRDVSNCIEISESTLYPILKRLETGGFLSTYSVEHGGRLRKYYHITSLGKRRVAEFDEEWKDLLRIHDFILRGAGGNE